ncbi:MAG: glycosyltransferase [Drouetiella hepatica Uher 2000/2452]|jgi:hopene-associated glycosyltransferase HpnB|uniref:Glycosyltransferase n=1 Tax=Drouetiella hepatica Uher 2000/2452 TaxID=904376 RepID=A0A951QAU7_9CYAN|nr:glycosyltransferase [Drouetiella hepatica Uher 2000/2452]
MTGELGLALAALSSLIWIILLVGRGQFWQADQKLESPEIQGKAKQWKSHKLKKYPAVCVVIPARNEVDMLPTTLPSLLNQDYPGIMSIILVDDHSTDGTAAIAKALARSQPKSQQPLPDRQLSVISGEPLPNGWTGKLWAIAQGICQAQSQSSPDYFLLTDADIQHDPQNISRLVTKAEQDKLDLVSLMVQLRCQSFWEQLLIPAFVFFFQKLYPFRWVNDPAHSMAAAAGGCILIRSTMLSQIGGIQAIRQALIDDCALAKAVKTNGGRIWLGLGDSTQSLRAYPSLMSIWNMVARTAFTQLNYSLGLLLGTALGMILIYGVPMISMIVGLLTQNWSLAIVGLLGWILMSWSYLPTIQLYRCSLILTFCLPMIALLYTLMTLDSALRHWRGHGGVWKGRSYSAVID